MSSVPRLNNGVPNRQLQIRRHLSEDEWETTGEIADALDIGNEAVRDAILRLRERGIAESRWDPRNPTRKMHSLEVSGDD